MKFVERRPGAMGALVAVLALVGACSDDDGSSSDTTGTSATPSSSTAASDPTTTTTEPPVLVTCDEIEPPVTTTTAAPASTASSAAPTTAAGPPTTAGPPPCEYTIDWDGLQAPVFWGYDDETAPDDPFWLLNNQPEDGFFFSLEMYTTGFGDAWEGETGTFEITCTTEGTGICLHFDPDGDGDEFADLNAGFDATGTIEITRLDDEGYDFTLTDVVFADGSTIPGPTRLRGTAPEAVTPDTTQPSTTDAPPTT